MLIFTNYYNQDRTGPGVYIAKTETDLYTTLNEIREFNTQSGTKEISIISIIPITKSYTGGSLGKGDVQIAEITTTNKPSGGTSTTQSPNTLPEQAINLPAVIEYFIYFELQAKENS